MPIEKRTTVHLAPPLQALEPNVGDHLEGNVEMMYVYFEVSIYDDTKYRDRPGALRYVRRPWHQEIVFAPVNSLEINIVSRGTMNPRNVRVHRGKVVGSTRGRGYATPGTGSPFACSLSSISRPSRLLTRGFGSEKE